MAYDRESTLRLLGDGNSVDLDGLARMVGNAEGGSVESQHRAALQFWEWALALVQEGVFKPAAVAQRVRAFAEGELQRQSAAVAPTPLAPDRYGPGGRSKPV